MTTPSPPYRALLHHALARTARTASDKPALHVGDDTCSYGDLNARAEKLAAALQARGLERGDRVALFMDNTTACAVSIFAVLKADGVFLVINPQTKHDKLCFIANDCGARHLMAADVTPYSWHMRRGQNHSANQQQRSFTGRRSRDPAYRQHHA